ncbi:TPA: hypothetical protein ACV20N_000424 [Acinetobacter baumannii]|uniref:hypothetical protein n=1 Tax=Acinetobacter baumannii TaxID=470 RepID=UPI0036F99688
MYLDNNEPNNILQILIKKLGLVAADSMTFGGASIVYDNYNKIIDYTKKCNDALYYLQVDKFLSSIEVDPLEFEKFLKENPDNLKLGLETIKILEQTHLDKQAGMLARALKLYIKNPTIDEKYKFHKNTHIITNIDHHLVNEVENLKKYPVEPHHSLYKTDQKLNFNVFVINPDKNLINFGFVKLPQTSIFTPGRELYVVSSFYTEFYETIFKD